MRRPSASRPRTEPTHCQRCDRPADAGTLCEHHAAAHRASEQRRQTRAARAGRCLACGHAVQPWRDSHLCALCARGNRSTKRRCSRCRQVGHRIETCVEPPADWLALGDQRIEPLPCCEPLSEAVRAEFERERAMARAEFDALTEQLSALQARVKRERARVEQLTRALAGEAIRDIAVEARAELERGVVVVVRLDTGEVVRERSMTEAERAANSPRFKRIERPGSPSSSGQIEAA